jgi:lysophospholipase L1-like esterase
MMPGDANGINYTNTAGFTQQITLTEVNFLTVEAGDVTPFVALWDGVSTSAASSYTFLAIGDSINCAASTLVNAKFQVGGVNPTINLPSGATMVAGYYQTGGRVLNVVDSSHSSQDYIYDGDSVTSVGAAPAGNSTYNFDRTVSYNIGFNVPAIPNPTVSISTPTTGSTFQVCESISFAATVSDEVDDDSALETSLIWTSDLETGAIGTGASCSTERLRVGTHTITATSTDSDLDVGTDSITLTVVNWNLGAIWFVGDSITQSVADGDSNGSPRKSLYDLLVAANAEFTFTGHWNANVDGLPATGGTAATNLYHYHSGISGSVIGANSNSRTDMTASTPGFWNSGRLATVKPNIVLIMLGTNDVDIQLDLDNAPTRIETLVNTILDQLEQGDPTPAIFVAQITPNTGSEAENSRVIEFNNALPDIVSKLQSEGKDVTLVDQFTRINADTQGLMRDTLHTNAAGNDVLAEQWYNALIERFGPAPTGLRGWQIEHFGTPCALEAALDQDSDADGLNNMLEYALGQNPNDSTPLSNTLENGVISFPKGSGANDEMLYTIEESIDLGINDPWDEVTPDLNDENEISYTLVSEKPANFVRLKVTQAP